MREDQLVEAKKWGRGETLAAIVAILLIALFVSAFVSDYSKEKKKVSEASVITEK